jgi:hypothetical protein
MLMLGVITLIYFGFWSPAGANWNRSPLDIRLSRIGYAASNRPQSTAMAKPTTAKIKLNSGGDTGFIM